jgi:anti-sigma factor ChrR (cupin superfamily)
LSLRIPGLRVPEDLEGLSWEPTRVPGVSWIPLHLEQDVSGAAHRGGGAVLIRMEPGAGYEAHRHLGPEDVLVLQGGYRDALGRYETGTHVHYPAESSHRPVALGDPGSAPGPENPACVLYAVSSGGIELLDRADEPPRHRRP